MIVYNIISFCDTTCFKLKSDKTSFIGTHFGIIFQVTLGVHFLVHREGGNLTFA